jgi:hypothetical protein
MNWLPFSASQWFLENEPRPRAGGLCFGRLRLRLLNASAWAMGGIKTSVEDVLSQQKV